MREAFDRFLRDGGPADVPGPRLPVVRGVELGRQAGARVSLAHPHSAGSPDSARPLLERAREAGLGGIEAFYGPYTVRNRRPGWQLAGAMGLVPTAGSDYHGPISDPGDPSIRVEVTGELADRFAESHCEGTWLVPRPLRSPKQVCLLGVGWCPSRGDRDPARVPNSNIARNK